MVRSSWQGNCRRARRGASEEEARDEDADLRLTREYVALSHAPADSDGTRAVALAQFGKYEVRLIEFVPEKPSDPTPFRLELYNHETHSAIDSRRCYNLEAAVQTTEQLMSCARTLDEESRGKA